MFTIKSAFRQVTAGPIRHLGARLLSTGAQPKRNAAARVLDRVKYFVWTNYPSRALACFHNELSSGRVPVRDRSDLYEAVVRVFVQNGLVKEARSVLDRLDSSEHVASIPLHVMVLTHELLSEKMTPKIFLDKIGKIVSSPKHNENMFMSLLNHLYRVGCSGEMLHEVANKYVASNKTLGPKGVGTLVHYLVQKEEIQQAGHWADYHAEQVQSRRDRITAADSVPYTNYMMGLLSVTKHANPGDVYIPILQKIVEDGAWPDIQFLNAAIEAEKGVGKVRTMMHLYGIILTLSDKGVLPDDATFAHLFIALLQNSSKEESTISPRDLFTDMIAAHIVASRHNRGAVVTSVSLGPALLVFTTSGDYAAAYRALMTYRTYHCPLTEIIVRKVITILASRCYEALRIEKPCPRTNWVIAFMGLESESRRWAFRHASIRDIHRRILELARHTVPDAPKIAEPAPVPVEDTVPGVDSVKSRSFVREKNVKRMRENKIGFLHTLLLRALAASFPLNDRSMYEIRQLTKDALVEANKSLSPSEAEAMKSRFALWYLNINLLVLIC